ncbi:hypothetical protein ALI144C_01810 [Actinosynnema sp. ALI-1.44]|uniref:hypothetical protein n=1 Tax=Actinosynnema sp. ALI-1.44 TaxID=1933779 RepID=UPI00097C001F|nr:hypothetical protein [Actinosynnema sp. ALI-1.44]ONI90988.1 hypothetical protein ALI144C_01810 [Actinosynnema sp. ALI-1.44]
MRIKSLKVLTVGFAVTAGALLSACSGQETAAPAPTVNVAPKNQTQGLHSGEAKNSPGKQVNCSTNGGKVGPHNVDLIAVETDNGIVGCTEAFTVITEYFENAGKSEGTGRHLEVRGWQCSADTGAQGTGSIGCDKDGLSFHTSAVQPTKKKAEDTRSDGGKVDKPAGSPADDVNCSQLFGERVGPAGGKKVDVIANGTENGNPGCDKAVSVLKEYFTKAPHGEGPGRRVLGIQGNWSCAKAAEPEGSQGVVYCGEDGPDGMRAETAPAK